MKCFKCDGELYPIQKEGKGYAQCNKCGSLFTADDLRNYTSQILSISSKSQSIKEKRKNNILTKIGAIISWIFCALFILCGLAYGGLSLLILFVATVLLCPIFRNRVTLSRKIWLPLVIVLFFTGVATAPTDTKPEKVAAKQETSVSASKEAQKANKEQDRKKQLEQERIAQEQAATKAEQERIAQEQAATKAEQERIAQEQAATQAEQERIAQEQAAAQAEQERIAQEQAAAQEQQARIAQEQAIATQTQVSSVWLSATGEKYHSIPNCGRMNPANAYQVTLAEAQQRGIQPCKNCH